MIASKGVFILQIFFVCSAITGQAQTLLLPTKTIETRANHLRADHLGKSYLIAGNNLSCLDSLGNPLFQFRQTTSGKLGTVDVTNPLKPLLFFPEFFELIFLDSRMNFQNSVNLREAGIMQPLAICLSGRGGFWVYDHQDFQLKYIAENLSVQFESGNLAQVTGTTVVPKQMMESENLVILNDPSIGLLIFDNFGNFLKTIPKKNAKLLQVLKQELIVVEEDSIWGIPLASGEPRKIELKGISTEGLIEVQFWKNMVYILRKGVFEIYQLKD